MKTRPNRIATGIGALALAFAAVTPAHADIKEAARKLHDDSQSALVGIKGLLKIDVTMNGQPAGNQETPIWGNGLVIGDGLVATAYQTLVPDVAAQAKSGGAPAGIEIKTNLAEVKFVDGSGEEFDAKLILHDDGTSTWHSSRWIRNRTMRMRGRSLRSRSAPILKCRFSMM